MSVMLIGINTLPCIFSLSNSIMSNAEMKFKMSLEMVFLTTINFSLFSVLLSSYVIWDSMVAIFSNLSCMFCFHDRIVNSGSIPVLVFSCDKPIKTCSCSHSALGYRSLLVIGSS